MGQQPMPPQAPQAPPMNNGYDQQEQQQQEQQEQQEDASQTVAEGADEYEDDAEYASQGLPPDNGYGGKTYSSGNGYDNGDDNWLSIPAENADEDESNQQSIAQNPMPPSNGGQYGDGYGNAQSPMQPQPPQNGQGQGQGMNGGYGYGSGQSQPMPPQNAGSGQYGYGQGQMPPNDNGYNNGYGQNHYNAGTSTGGFDQFRGIGQAEDESADGLRIFAANIDEEKNEVDIESDINIIDQKPANNIARTIKFGYAEIFIVFICIVLLVCGAALLYTRRRDEKLLKLMDNEPKYTIGYSTFEQV